jgi:hypothetical protein
MGVGDLTGPVIVGAVTWMAGASLTGVVLAPSLGGAAMEACISAGVTK